MENVKKIKWTFIGISAVMLILGLCLVVWPYFSATMLCYLLGLAMLITGIVKVICYARREVVKFIYYYELPLGILDILVALVLFLHPHNMIMMLPIVVGIVILVDSIFKLQVALDLKRMGWRSWWGILLFSIVSVLFAFLLMINPFEGSMTLMIFIGLSLIADSIQSFCIIFYVAKYIKKISPIDGDYVEIE